MTDRAGTLVDGRRERMERVLERKLAPPSVDSGSPPSDDQRRYLQSEAVDLYWNELEWERITDEEALDEGPLVTQTFPGFLAYVRGLLLAEVMPDSLSPASPRPEVVEDVLAFLAARVVELGDALSGPDDDETARLSAELEITNSLIDQVLYLYYDLGEADIERLEAAAQASA